MGWPKGKPRGPKKPKPEKIAARYDPDAVPFQPQPDMPSGNVTAEEAIRRSVEAAVEVTGRLARAKRRSRQGVTIDGRWFACQTAILIEDRFVLLDGAIETRVPIEGVKKLEFHGVSLSTAEGSPSGTIAFSGTGTPGLRIVDVGSHVNVDPDREQESRAHSRRQNRELEDLMGAKS
jgi:hypothetical protein